MPTEEAAILERQSRVIPSAGATSLSLHLLMLLENRLAGSVPAMFHSLISLSELELGYNQLTGSIQTVGHWSSNLYSLNMEHNRLSGSLPCVIQSLLKMRLFYVTSNHLSGSIPDALIHLTLLVSVCAGSNHLSGAIPSLCNRLRNLFIEDNQLSGPALDWATTQIAGVSSRLTRLRAPNNQLTGSFPEAISELRLPSWTILSRNKLRGTLPGAIHMLLHLSVVALSDNMLAGRIPDGYGNLLLCDLSSNKLTGSFPQTRIFSSRLRILRCSGNSLEGILPSTLHEADPDRGLQFLDVSGTAGAAGHLRGPLPATLARAWVLKAVLAHNQMLEDSIPSLVSSLRMLVLHSNLLKTLPDLRFETGNLAATHSDAVILLHQNGLSCNLPRFGKARATLSLAAFGNQFWHPGARPFPRWISHMEKDGLFWASRMEILMLGLKLFCGAVLFAGAVMMTYGGGAFQTSRVVIVRWHTAADYQRLAKQCAHHTSCMMMVSLRGLVLLPYLLQRAYHKCPRGLVLASACLRESRYVRMVVILFWGAPCLNFSIGWHTSRRARAQRMSIVKRCLLVVCWLQLALALSALSAIDQGGKSIPSFFKLRGGAPRAISICIGGVQSVILKYAIPRLAQGLPSHARFLEGLTNLFISCVIPASVIIYLDSACMENWTSFWEPCSPRRARSFHRALHCPGDASCPKVGAAEIYSDIQVLRSSDICRPQRVTSSSNCVQVTLIRLQDVWLSKWITTGLVAPAMEVFFLQDMLQRNAVVVLRQMALASELALLASGPLPLLGVVLLVAAVTETFMAAKAWAAGTLQEMTARSFPVESRNFALLMSLALYGAFAVGDFVSSLVVLVFASRLAVGMAFQPRRQEDAFRLSSQRGWRSFLTAFVSKPST